MRAARSALLALSLAAAVPAVAQTPPPKCVAALDGCSLAIPRELSTTSDIFDALLSGAKAARERGDLAKALTDLDEAVKRRPQSALAHYLRGLTLGDRGELERAVDALDFAIRLKGDFTEAMRARGFAQYKRREFIFALEDFARVLPKNPTDVEIVAARGDMYVRMGDWDKALAELNRELALRPGHYLAVARRGDAWRGKGRTDAALNEYALAARLAPGYWPVRHARAVIYEERREYDKALAEYDAVRRHSPRHAPSLAQRCGIKTILDRLAEALPDCEAALQGHGRVKDDDQVALTWLGLIAYGLGDFVRAREMLDGAIAQKGAWPRANYARALLRETLGDTSGSFRDMTAARRYTESPADWERVQVELSRFRRGPWCHVPMPCGTIPAGSIKSDGCGCGP